jgi:hypothetical protein
MERLIEAFGVGIGIGIETDNEKTDSDPNPDFRPRISAKTLIFMRHRVRHKGAWGAVPKIEFRSQNSESRMSPRNSNAPLFLPSYASSYSTGLFEILRDFESLR